MYAQFIITIAHNLGFKKIPELKLLVGVHQKAVSYTHLTLPTNTVTCRSRWSPYH